MKVSFVLMLALLFAANAHAETTKDVDPPIVSMRVDFEMDGEISKSANLLARSGSNAEITDSSLEANSLFIEASPTVRKNDQIFVRCRVGHVVKGRKVVDAEPSMLVNDGQEAEVEQTDSKTKRTIRIRVLPTIL